MANTERLEAKGPRGEACIIIRTWLAPDASHSGNPTGDRGPASYRLATGERLNTTDDTAVFVTIDGSRRFVLRGIL